MLLMSVICQPRLKTVYSTLQNNYYWETFVTQCTTRHASNAVAISTFDFDLSAIQPPSDDLTPIRLHFDRSTTIINNNKSAQRDANTARQTFSPRRRPAGAGPPKFNQLELVTTFTYRPSLVKIDARNFELSW